MTDRPILFSAPMVRALLDGRKTQTRRIYKPPAPYAPGNDIDVPLLAGSLPIRYAIGDRLWVREAFHATEGFTKPHHSDCAHLFGYQVDGQDREWTVAGIGRVREFAVHLGGWGGRVSKNYPGIHMPRWASRLTLLVDDVRVQRLMDISEDDAKAEGFEAGTLNDAMPETPIGEGWTISSPGTFASAVGMFLLTWQDLHPEWDGFSSPWVVAITFRVVRANIDSPEARTA